MATRRNAASKGGLKASRRAHLLALEPRMMFDAAIAATNEAVVSHMHADAGGHHSFTTPTDVSANDAPARAHTVEANSARPVSNDKHAQQPEEAPAPAAAPASHEIIFIDEGVENYEQLAAEWASRGQVILINDQSDGVAQVEAALAGESNVSAIHIVSHGEEGAFFLGTTKVDQASITGNLSGELAQIGKSLEPGGDILIYGCDFAEGTDGAAALHAFATATGADVAASTDLTGAADKGGDWTLEAHDGAIQARSLYSSDYQYVLGPNTPVPIAVTANTLTVTDGSGNVVVSSNGSSTTGLGSDNRSPDVGVGAVAVWANAATFNGQALDLKATVVSLSTGDAVRFNAPGGTSQEADDATFLLRDLTNNGTDATISIKWELVLHGTNTDAPADVEFTIGDIDGIGGQPNTRESVSTSTDNLAYYTREKVSDINFTSSLSQITASGTQNENTDTSKPENSASNATFDWTDVSSFVLNYKLTTNTVATQAQFYQDGNATLKYTDPVYVSIPRLDLDADDSTAPGNDAHFTYTEDGSAVPIVDSDVKVTNPMDSNSIIGASVVLTNAKSGDVLTVGALPSNITDTITNSNGQITVTFSGNGSEADYQNALKAVTFSNTLPARPDTTQRVIDVTFSNDVLTSATAVTRIDVVDVNHPPVANNDAATTNENTPVSINVLANDTDVDGDTLTVTGASALHGTVVRNADNTLTYTPNQYYYGSDTITYSISDGNGGTSSATVAITVDHINQAPVDVGTLPDQSTQDAKSVSYATASSFSDPDRDTLAYSATGLPDGLTIDGATGVISGTVDRSASQANGGVYTVMVKATDPSNASNTQTFRIAVTNPPPTANNDSATTNENTPVNINVLANDTDPDGDPLTVTGASAQHGTVVRNADNTLTYMPNQYYFGSDTINYTISDGQGGTSAATVAVTINHVNQVPVDVGTIPDKTANDADSVSYATKTAFSDPDGDTLTYSVAGLPTGLTIDSATGMISGTIDRSASQVNGGVYTVQVTATDPSNAASTQSFHIDVANPAPTARNDTATTSENRPVIIAVLGNDTDPDNDPLTVTSASAQHGTVARNSDGTITYTPNQYYYGSDMINYSISDGQGGTSSATVAVTISHVNQAPQDSGSLPQRSTVDSATVSWATAGGFTDPDGDTLSYAATGLPQGLTIDSATGVISGTLGHSDSQVNGGHYAIAVTATDPSGLASTQTLTVDVANPAPHAGNDRATVHVDTPADIVVLANDSDPDGDPISVTAASAANGTISINPDGTLHYTPHTGFSGTDTIAYTITDGDGATGHAIVTVTVSDAPPAVSPVANQTAQDGQSVKLPVGNSFSDPDGDTLTYTATGLPTGLSIDPSTGVISGTIDRSASQSAGGIYYSVVTADDGHGGATSEAFRWNVTNPAPTARDDSATTPENSAVVIAPLANDTDPDGDPLSIDNASAPHGNVAINADGTITYTPNADFVGSDVIAYTITDGQGGHAAAHVTVIVTPVDNGPGAVALAPRSDQDNGTVSVPTAQAFSDTAGNTLTYSATGLPNGVAIDPATGIISGTLGAVDDTGGPNGDGTYPVTVIATDPAGRQASSAFTWSVAPTGPIAQDDTATTLQGTPVTIDVGANDSDPSGASFAVSEATAYHGQVAIKPDNMLSFTPDATFRGDAIISYTITDANGAKASATVTVTVTPVNHAPIAMPIPATYGQDAQSGIAIPASSYFSDPDGDALTYSATSLPPGLSLDPSSGLISGTIDHSASQVNGGIFHVVVTATDGSGAQANNAFDWTITNPAPTAHDDSAGTTQNTPAAINVLANDVDPDGDALMVTRAVAGHGSVAINPDGTITYRPNAGYVGSDVISYAISDGQGGRSTAAVAMSVVAPNHPPVANPDTAATRIDTPVTLAVLTNDTDPDDDPIAVTGASAQHGTVAINPDGTVTYTPDAGYSGADTIAYAISDGRGGTASSTVAVNVSDRAPVVNPIQAETRAGTPVTLDPLANASDPDGDPLSITQATAQHGSVVINPNGTLTYTPNAGYNGADTIAYVVSDEHGGATPSVAAVTVDPDRPPVVNPDTVSTRAGSPVIIPVLANDSDPDGDPLTVTGATAQHGTVAINPDGTITYTPNAGYSGADTIAYVVDDGHGGTGTSTVALAVIPNTAPTIDPRGPVNTIGGRPVTIDGLAGAHDADGDPLTVTSATAAAGTVVVNPDNMITFIPARGFAGTTSITYTIDDGHGGTATATIVVRVALPQGTGDMQQSLAIGRGVSPAWESPPGASGGSDDTSIGFGGVGTGLPGGAGFGDGTSGHGASFAHGPYDGRDVYRFGPDGFGLGGVRFNGAGLPTGFDPESPIELRSDGVVHCPFPTLSAINAIRSLNGTTDVSGETPLGDAVEGVRSLDGIGEAGAGSADGLGGVPGLDGAGYAVLDEAERLGRLADYRDAAARLYDQRWGDLGNFGAHPYAGFSAAADLGAGVEVETIMQGGAIYVDVRDTAPDAMAGIRSVAFTLKGGGKPEWISVDHRGFAIIEASATTDEIHLVVSVTRTDGSHSSTPIVIQGATGELELDRHAHAAPADKAGPVHPAPHGRAALLDATLHTPHAAAHAAAHKLSDTFK